VASTRQGEIIRELRKPQRPARPDVAEFVKAVIHELALQRKPETEE
jgi:hypothetical protein